MSHKAHTGQLPLVEGGSLPTWLVKPESAHRLRITCTRCQGWAIVPTSWGVGGYATRPCTHCFKTSKVPPRLRAGRRRRPTTTTKEK
jgi:hypothetical protein